MNIKNIWNHHPENLFLHHLFGSLSWFFLVYQQSWESQSSKSFVSSKYWLVVEPPNWKICASQIGFHFPKVRGGTIPIIIIPSVNSGMFNTFIIYHLGKLLYFLNLNSGDFGGDSRILFTTIWGFSQPAGKVAVLSMTTSYLELRSISWISPRRGTISDFKGWVLSPTGKMGNKSYEFTNWGW